MHTVNGDGSKTAKIITGTINHTNIDIQATLVRLIVPFYDFCGFRSVADNNVYKLQFFTYVIYTLCLKLSVTLSSLNRFSKFLHCWKAYEICYKTHMTLPTSP